MGIFGTSPNEFFSDIGKKTINQTNNSGSIGYVETLYQENKEKSEKIEKLYELRLKDKDDLINQLKIVIEKLSK